MAGIVRQWFQPGDGIAREVITADIQRYLGQDALVRPGEGTGEYEGVQGYWITAYRNLTTQMVQDLKLDSQRWRAEVQQGRVAYQDSQTHQSRQYYGPSAPAAAPPAVSYQAPQPHRQAYAPTAHQSYGGDSAYTYQQPAYGQPASQYAAPAYGQPQAQIRTAPTYTYTQPAAQQDPHNAYGQHGDTRQYYPQTAVTAPPRNDQYVQQQPSTTQTYYGADGRPIQQPYSNAQQPANHGRRRG